MALVRPPSSTTEEASVLTAIVMDKDNNSQFAVKWAVDNFLTGNSSPFILIHFNLSCWLFTEDFEASLHEGRPPTEAGSQQFFLPNREFCAQKRVQEKEVVLCDIDVPSALVDYIINDSIDSIVVGASSHNSLIRKFSNADVPASSAPESCAVSVISEGKVQSSCPANQAQRTTSNATIPKGQSLKGLQSNSKHAPAIPTVEEIKQGGLSKESSRSEGTDRTSINIITDSFKVSPSAKCELNGEITSPPLSLGSGTQLLESLKRDFVSDDSVISDPTSFPSSNVPSEKLEFTMESSTSFSCQNPKGLEAKMRRLQNELKQSMELYNLVCKEAAGSEKREKLLQEWKAAEEHKLVQLKLAERAALALAEAEMQKTKAAIEAAHVARLLADLEDQKRKLAEMKARNEAEEIERALGQFAHQKAAYRKYSINEIEIATDYFADSHKIGEGGYGSVFRAMLQYTRVAIKVLAPGMSQGQKQFQQEVEILSCMRHPHLVLLIGACPESGCLIYEYMENGSLEDRLFRKDNTPSIPWKTRFRIAAEIATGLNFLHQKKPEALVHRDLKPGNILLDQNYVSKISDVGLARLVPPPVGDSVNQYRLTAAAGTFCYVDPEYQQTGMLGVKSDLYSLGMVLLQIITAKHPVGLSIQVKEAIEKGTFQEVLDPTVPDWPVEEALSLAKLALQCCELRKKDRPDLESVVLPELIRLRDLGSENEATVSSSPCNSVPQMETHLNQVFVRSKLRPLKYKTRMSKMRRTSILPTCGEKVGKSRRKSVEGTCWSFISCSGTSAQIREFKSFS
ncbi:hypothetical protein SLA2020_290610 [Shorea laevis]